MKKVFLTLLVLMMLSPLNLSSTAIGVIALDCGTFIQKDREDYNYWRPVFLSAFQSYISALEWHSKGSKAGKLTPDSLYYSILKMCKDKPRTRIDDIVLEFYFEKL